MPILQTGDADSKRQLQHEKRWPGHSWYVHTSGNPYIDTAIIPCGHGDTGLGNRGSAGWAYLQDYLLFIIPPT